MPTSSDAKAAEILSSLKSDLLDDAIHIVRGNASLAGAIGTPEDLRPGESLDVDFKKGAFAVKNPQGTILSGDCQIIGEFVPETKTLTWSFKSKSHPNRAFRDIEHFMRADKELVALAECGSFSVEDDRAQELAGWIAVRAGFRGVYALPDGEHLSLVALNLTRLTKHRTKPDENLWCLFCGEDGRDGTILLKLTEAHAVCEDCVAEAREALELQEEMDGLKGTKDKIPSAPPEDAPFAMSYCVMCARRLPSLIVINDLACVCRSCIQVASETLSAEE